MFVYDTQKYIGAYAAAMNGLDCVVFTGGIGENAYESRESIMENMEFLGIELDREKNWGSRAQFIDIAKPESKVRILVIPTNEELVIARQTKEIVENK